MWNRLRRWLHAIPIPDPLARRQALLVQNMLIGLIAIILIRLPLAVIALDADHYQLLGTLTLLLLLCYIVLVLTLLRRGHFANAVMLTTLSLILALAIFMLQLGIGNDGSLLLGFALPITLIGLLAGRKQLWLVVGLSTAVVFSIALLDYFSIWQPNSAAPQNSLVLASDFVLVAVLLGLFLDMLSTSLREALATAVTREHALAHEVEARQLVEAALRESEERYRLITENSSDLISLIDLTGDAEQIYVSPSYQAMLGYDPASLLGPLQPDIVHPDDRKRVFEQYDQLAASGSARVTYRMRHSDGSWRWIELQATAISQHGRYYGVTVGRDVSDRKHLEAQLMQSQRLESVGRLAGGVAHDFNNLLTAIMGNTELARDSLPDGHPVHADLDEVMKSSKRAAELTRQLLAFARRQIIEPHVIDLNQLILDMDKLLRRLIGAHIELIVHTDPSLWPIRADHGQIEQVVVNLAINARDAMPNGGTLTIETRNAQLDHDYARRHISVRPGRYVMLAISDTGTGIDDETLAQIFEPFFSTKAPGRGTGLGLATCYGIVKQHGGNIWPYSEPGHGSTFKIYLPQVDAPIEQFPLPTVVDELPRGTETVLLAEDEPSVRMLAARVLRAQGYTVVEAKDGDAALQLARAWVGTPFDLLITDVVMPRMSGRMLAGLIQPLFPASAVLFISGYTDNAIVHHGQLDPGIVFLQKPFSPAALTRKVREVLDSRAG
jgi:two-component system, cell cycle sensor histidine kinase and response regulator CckA